MISVPAIIETLGAAGISIECNPLGNLRLTPGSAVIPRVRALILANKPQIVAWLAEHPRGMQEMTPPVHTHRLIEPLVFNDPASSDGLLEIPVGVTCAIFRSLSSARVAGCLSATAQWAASANLQKGYWLGWLQGALRGVSPFSVRLLDA